MIAEAKFRGKNNPWTLLGEFDSLTDAVRHFVKNKEFSKHSVIIVRQQGNEHGIAVLAHQFVLIDVQVLGVVDCKDQEMIDTKAVEPETEFDMEPMPETPIIITDDSQAL